MQTKRLPTVDDGDDFGSTEGRGRRLELEFTIFGASRAQLAEDGHQSTNFFTGDFGLGQFEGFTQLVHPGLYNFYFLLQAAGQGQHHRVEAALQSTGEFIHPAVAVIGSSDDVETTGSLYLRIEFGNGQGFFRKDSYQCILHIRWDARELFNPHQLAVLHAVHHRTGHQGPFGRALG